MPGRRKFKKERIVLETKRSELLVALQQRDDIAIEKVAEDMDNLQLSVQRELAISHLHMDSGLLRNVLAALNRIEDGSYGMCLHCEEPIAPRRLTAVPWAAYCIKCQEAVDRGEIEEDSSLDDMDLSDAA